MAEQIFDFRPEAPVARQLPVPEVLRPLVSPIVPQLGELGKSLGDVAQREAYKAYGPEAEGRSTLERVAHGAGSLGSEGAAALLRMLGGVTPGDAAMMVAGGKTADLYFAGRGAAGATESVPGAVHNPTPENVQKALFDVGMATGPAAHFAERAASPKVPLIPQDIPNLDLHAQKIADLATENGGATYHLKEGNRAGHNHYAVSPIPERTVQLPGPVTPDSVREFIRQNWDILENNPKAHVGVWNAPDGSHYLDVTGTTHDLNSALSVAKKYNQQAIFDLQKGQEIPVGGNGIALDTPEFQTEHGSRLSELAPSPEKTLFSGVHFSASPVKESMLSGNRRGGSTANGMRATGEESQRLSIGRGAPPGVYFYKEGTLAEPQIASRPHEYRTEGHKALADIATNDKWHQAQMEAFTKAKSEGMPDQEAYMLSLNEAEHALRDAGYDGYYNSQRRPNITFLFGDVPVQSLKDVQETAGQRGSIRLGAKTLSKTRLNATPTEDVAAAAVRTPAAPVDPAAVIKQAGGSFVGRAGFAQYGKPEQILFNDPTTGTTLAVPEDGLTPDLIRQHMEESRAKFAKARSPFELLNKQEISRMTPQGRKKFVDSFQKLPDVQELAAVTKAGLAGKDWYPTSAKAFRTMQSLAPEYFKPGEEIKFANVVGATSPHQAVKENLREALDVWKQWVDAGRPTKPKEIMRKVKPLSLPATKYANLVSALMGQDLFTGRKSYLKAPSFGQALGGTVPEQINWRPKDLEKGIPHNEPVSVEIPIKDISISQKGLDRAQSHNLIGRGSKTQGPIKLFYNTDNKQVLVEDGMHRLGDVIAKGKRTIKATIWSGYSDSIANVRSENRFVPGINPKDESYNSPQSRDTFVGDTHMADLYNIDRNKMFKNSAELYNAAAAKTRQVARTLNIDTRDAQAAMWSFKVTLAEALGENPTAPPKEILQHVTDDRIRQEKRDFADLLLRDQEVRKLLQYGYGVDLDKLDKGLQRIVKAGQRTKVPAAPKVEPNQEHLARVVERLRPKYGSVIPKEEGDVSFNPAELAGGSSLPALIRNVVRSSR